MLSIALSDSVADLEQIIALQRANHSAAVAADLWDTQGFVTMEYTVPQLQMICGPYRHVVAKDGDTVIGYALILLRDHRAAFPFLHDMFEQIEAGIFEGKPIRDSRYFVMGQVCIAEEFRGKGIFTMLYRGLKEQMSADFDLVATEVSTRNGRSMRAHRDIGFHDIRPDDTVSEWRVIAWDWCQAL